MTQPRTTAQPVSRDQLDRFCLEAMCRSGMTETDARLASDVLVTTDLWGVHTHGTKSLRLYLKRIRGSALAKGSDRIWLPGEIEAEKMKQALSAGMVLPTDVRESLRGLAEDVGIKAEWL